MENLLVGAMALGIVVLMSYICHSLAHKEKKPSELPSSDD